MRLGYLDEVRLLRGGSVVQMKFGGSDPLVVLKSRCSSMKSSKKSEKNRVNLTGNDRMA